MLCCEIHKLGMMGIAFMGDVGREDAPIFCQQVLRLQACQMFDHLARAQMIAAGLIRAVGMVENDQIKPQL